MKMLRKFAKDKSGNVTMMFTVAMGAVLTAVGLAVDYAGIRDANTVLQGQVDAAVLALGKSGATDAAERREIVWGSMIANGYPADGPEPEISVGDDGVIRVAGVQRYDAMLMGVFGRDVVNIRAAAESMMPNKFGVEIVMVLDTTGSMSGSKILSLKNAAKSLVSSVAVYDNADVKIGMVPFSSYVNVGLANRNASWIDVPADWSETYNYQPIILTNPGSCSGTESYDYVLDGVTYTGTRGTGCTAATYANNGPVEERTRDHVWSGCVGSRLDPLHLEDGSYATRIPGLLDQGCADPISPLTNDYASLITAIEGLNAGRDTYMPAGLMWGLRALSPQAPMVVTGSQANTRKMMILMTDGMNTMHKGGNYHGSTDNAGLRNQTDMDTKALCAKAAAEGVELFTVAFEVTDVPTRKMLEGCAATPGHYFNATNSAQLIAAFKNIAGRIVNVRLTK